MQLPSKIQGLPPSPQDHGHCLSSQAGAGSQAWGCRPSLQMSHLFNQRAEIQGGEGRLLSRFHDHGVSTAQGRCQLPHQHQQREVPLQQSTGMSRSSGANRCMTLVPSTQWCPSVGQQPFMVSVRGLGVTQECVWLELLCAMSCCWVAVVQGTLLWVAARVTPS